MLSGERPKAQFPCNPQNDGIIILWNKGFTYFETRLFGYGQMFSPARNPWYRIGIAASICSNTSFTWLYDACENFKGRCPEKWWKSGRIMDVSQDVTSKAKNERMIRMMDFSEDCKVRKRDCPKDPRTLGSKTWGHVTTNEEMKSAPKYGLNLLTYPSKMRTQEHSPYQILPFELPPTPPPCQPACRNARRFQYSSW